MKKIILMSFPLLVLWSCNQNKMMVNDVKGGEHEDVKRIYKGEIDEITVSTSIDAEIIKGNEERVVLKGEHDVLKDVKVKLENGVLHIYQESNNILSFSDDAKVKAKIYVKDFTDVEANSSADIQIKDQFTQDKVRVVASSSGSIKGNLEANTFLISVSSSGEYGGKIWAVDMDAKVSSSGDIKVEGKAKTVNVKVSSSGDFDGKLLQTKIAHLSASSSGSIAMKVLNEVDASASSSGDVVVYAGTNLVKNSVNESSAGDVTFKQIQ